MQLIDVAQLVAELNGSKFRIVVEGDLRPLHTTCYPDKTFIQFRDHFDKMMAWQAQNRCCWLAACDDTGQIVASGQLVLYPHGSELANLVVVPDRQNEGIGTALVEALTAVARQLNLTSLEIGVAQSNSDALRLYQRLGFVVDRQLCQPCQEPALVLRKTL
jgi:ribosomal protein S18 acetylase RimI-like enzyme